MQIDAHKKLFGSQAENYTRYRLPYIDETYSLFFSKLPEGSTKILDIACGTGKSTEPLVRTGLEIYGVDHDSRMIAEAQKQAAQKNLPIHYAVAAVEHLPYADNTFDAITVGTAFHWFVNDAAIAEIQRVLKPGGLLFIYWTLTTKDVPEEDSIPREIFTAFNWERVPQELRNLDHIAAFLSAHGLEQVLCDRLPFTHNDTVDDQVGLMTTASSYEMLSEEDKKKFLNAIRTALTSQLGTRPYFTYEEEIQVVHGYKAAA